MKKRLAVVSAILSVIIALCGILSVVTLHNNASFSPEYDMIDLSPLCEKTVFSEEDYKTFFYQTGLGKYAIDSIKDSKKFKETVSQYQQDFFKKSDYICDSAAITTSMEYSLSESGYLTQGFKMFPVKEGYVLLMESSHSFGWRHGHAGIVVSNDRVLEAPIIGEPSQEYSLSTWLYYPTFIMLRLKDTSDEDLKSIAIDAERYLNGIIYHPVAGVFKKEQGRKPKTVQCAYLVWYAFFNHGIDIDSDGGNIVTVNDIKQSDKFEIVQIYGYDPDLFY